VPAAVFGLLQLPELPSEARRAAIDNEGRALHLVGRPASVAVERVVQHKKD
jgi:hypothetical protein